MTTRWRATLASFGWRQWLLVAVLLVALAAAAMFAVRTVRGTVYWAQHRDEPIERWMPVNYIAHSYNVPPEVLWEALGVPYTRGERRRDFRPVSKIAAERGQTFTQARAALEDAIARARQSPGPPTPPPRDNRGVP